MAPLASAAYPLSSTGRRGTPPRPAQSPPRRGGPVSAGAKDHVDLGQAQQGPTTSQGGRSPTKPPRAPLSQRRSSPPVDGAAGRTPPQPHSSRAAAQGSERSTSGPARRRQGPRHPTGSQGSEPTNSRTGEGAPLEPPNQEKLRIVAPSPAKPHAVTAILPAG
ncbi:hypothetical protein NDU88_005146 [Pleurodeles waltl]|uniref:Uncharacterized protein n=1 Tax=Pleurodeles waltl TaxID=8319 RepID=A0AAV7LLV9_PLEWA|nr:hypothetical protein NDU88_005146 [Pleurodeles waltl]